MNDFGYLDLGIDFSKVKNIILVNKPADLRKGIDGYASIIQGIYHLDPTDGSLYLFTNRTKDKMKGILHDGNGYWLVYKRLARSHLKWPFTEINQYQTISSSQLQALLSGMTIVPDPQFLPQKPKYI
ncbi:IS66 family insertion sequence element accessory protein TnpB [Allobaculum stercoricanis]|uniref:IS66 family insertion sequence element accessory protein TnpB n=2 Tax=Allobaculum stercoricanis TaxID=174709 RepID=UPI00036A76E4|nr:IS66 family insertion sequence element accessory protein TnpB [Allobaculum stercoricanis]